MIRRIMVMSVALLFVCIVNSQELDWGKSIGSTGSDYATANCVDEYGNIFTVGSFTGTVDFDPGPGVHNLTATGGADGFILKLDANGNFVFANYILPGTGTELARTVAVALDGTIYVGGAFSGTVSGPLNSPRTSNGLLDGFVLSLTPTGSYIDLVNFGSTGNDYVNTVCCNNGAVCAGGTFLGTVDFNPGSGVANLTATGTSGFLARYISTTGNMTHSWSYVLGTAVNGSEMDASGNIWSTGSYTGTFDFNFGGGVNNLTSAGGSDIFVQKVTATGALTFAKSYGGTGNDVGIGLKYDSNFEIYNSGYFNGTADFDPSANTLNLTSAGGNDAYVSKLTATGDLVWAKGFGGTGDDQAIDVDFDQLFSVYCAGYFNSTVDFDPGAGTTNYTSLGSSDGFVSKFSSTGQFTWARTIGAASNDFVTGINTSATDGIYLSGYYQGTIDIDPGAGIENLMSSGSNDVFVAKWRSCATMPSVANITPPASLNICEGNSTTLTATGQGTISWYSSETGGTYLGSGASFNTGVLNTDSTFYVQDSTCVPGLRIPVIVNVVPPIQNQTVSVNNATVCSGQSDTVSIASSEVGKVYYLRNNANDTIIAGPIAGTGSSLNFSTGPIAATTTYNVNAISSPPNYALDFDGTNDYVNLGNNNRGVVSAITVQARVRAGATGATQYIAYKYNTVTGFLLYIDAAGKAHLDGRDGSGGYKSSGASTTTVADNNWHIVTGVVRSSGWEIYVDGVLENSGAYSLGSPGLGNTTNLTLASNGSAFSPVDIDEFAIFDNSLSPSTIQNYASGCLFGSEPDLTGLFKLDDGNGTVAVDNSATAINGTLVNMVAPACWISGGTNNCVSGCELEMSNTVTVTVSAAPAQPTITAGGPTVICNGDSVTLTSSVGNSYLWSTGATTQSIIVSTAGTYTVKVTNGAGCQSVSSAGTTVTVGSTPAQPTITAGGATTFCQGDSVSLTSSNGNSYLWSTGATTQSINVTSSGTYTVKVTNASGCQSVSSAATTVTVNNNPTANIQPTSVTICSGKNATLTASGGGTYAWSNSGGSNAQATFSPSNTTTYTVTVTNANSCSATASKTVTVNSNPTATIQPTSVTICSGTSATLTASGGGTYAWSNSGGTNAQATFSPSNTTTYTVTVTNANNCTATASKTVTVNSSPTATIQPTSVTICSGTSATLTASGGGTYAWSNSGGSNAQATFSPSNTTTYTVTVTNANNCTATASKTVTVNSSPTAAIQPASVTICSGTSATLTASGGGTYAWSNSGGSNAQATFSPSNTTTYTVTVTNAANCTAIASKTVTVNQTPVASINGPTTICSGLNATLTASGGGTYAWSNSGGSNAQATFSPTATTTYTVTVTGAGSCTATASQTVSVQSAPTATIVGANTVCAGGSVTLTANGGNTYAWANGLGSNAAITVSPTQTTTYTVTVSIGANCTATASKIVTVNQPTASTINQTICTGKTFTFNGQPLTQSGIYKDTLINTASCDSIITLNLTVTPALQGSFSQTICTGKTFTFNGQQLAQSGTYKDTVQTSGGCDSIITLSLTVAPALQGSFSKTACFDETYTFNGQQLAQSGTYKDTVQTSGGCDSIITLNFTKLNKIEETVNAQICTGQTYDFKGQQLSQAGQYLDTLQTSFGCDSFVTLNLTVNSFVTGNFSHAICTGASYNFNNQQLTQAGQYTDTLVSVGGCDSIVTLTLTVNALPNPTITQTGNLLSTQTFNSYQWQLNGSDISNATNQDHTATQNGNYTVVVTDANGCENTSSAVNVTGVGINEILNLRLSIYPNPANDFVVITCDEQIETVEVFNVVGEQILFVKGEIKTINVSPLAAGTYLLHVTTAKGGFRKTFIKE